MGAWGNEQRLIIGVDDLDTNVAPLGGGWLSIHGKVKEVVGGGGLRISDGEYF